jgi:hypothetical protein
MDLDTGQMFKQPVFCPHCQEERLFTLRAIAHTPRLKCPGCGGRICLTDNAHEALLSEVRNQLAAIDSVPIRTPLIDQRP